MPEEKYSEALTKLIDDTRKRPAEVDKSAIKDLNDEERLIYTNVLSEVMNETVTKFRSKLK